MSKPKPKVHTNISYNDPYVQPLILSALSSQLPPSSYTLSTERPPSSPPSFPPLPTRDQNQTAQTPTLYILPYESLPFPSTSQPNPPILLNALPIRKALIRKHHLPSTIAQHVAKNPSSPLNRHYDPRTEHFELDYAEFLDDALVECFELRASLARNEARDESGGDSGEGAEREWWILKPGLSDGGNGIRLFSSFAELQSIFGDWEDDADDSSQTADADDEGDNDHDDKGGDGINASHLRHFTAQPYIHPPLLLSETPFCNRKFHIRVYVVAAGALSVYVYGPKLALFAAAQYQPPWTTSHTSSTEKLPRADPVEEMRRVHLTNTCVSGADTTAQKPDSVFLLSDLPLPQEILTSIEGQMNDTIAALFRAASAQPIHFQAQPTSFEIFGVDFLLSNKPIYFSIGEAQDQSRTAGRAVDHQIEKINDVEIGGVSTHLLEVNAFPDFAQTGVKLRDVMVGGLWEEVFGVIVRPYFGIGTNDSMDFERRRMGSERLIRVLDLDLGRR